MPVVCLFGFYKSYRIEHKKYALELYLFDTILAIFIYNFL